MERHIDISRFDYDLPDERIAKFPLPERSSSKLLVYRGGEISEAHFADMGDVLHVRVDGFQMPNARAQGRRVFRKTRSVESS